MKASSFYMLFLVFVSFSTVKALAQVSAEDQIKMAVLAAPVEYQAGATVYGFNNDGSNYTLREGNNEFYCIADNQEVTRFQVSCYHDSLEAFMERGRELRAEGKNPQEIFDIREEEEKSGKLEMPKAPATMHVYYGEDVTYDEEENKLVGGGFRYVVYIPFATQETTGLGIRPNGAGHPWLMDPGTHRAHIMITPPSGN